VEVYRDARRGLVLVFYLPADQESIWFSAKDGAPQTERKIVSSPKMMLTVVWNSQGFHLIDVLRKGSKLHPGDYISHIPSDSPNPKFEFLLLIKTAQGDIF
jgi:hypothetical protein